MEGKEDEEGRADEEGLPFIPFEMWAHIFSFLDEVSIILTGLVCTDFRALSRIQKRTVLFGAYKWQASPPEIVLLIDTPAGRFTLTRPSSYTHKPTSIVLNSPRPGGDFEVHALKITHFSQCIGCVQLDYSFRTNPPRGVENRHYVRTVWYEQKNDEVSGSCFCFLHNLREASYSHQVCLTHPIRLGNTFTLCPYHTRPIRFSYKNCPAQFNPFGQKQLNIFLEALAHLTESIGHLRKGMGIPRPPLRSVPLYCGSPVSIEWSAYNIYNVDPSAWDSQHQ